MSQEERLRTTIFHGRCPGYFQRNVLRAAPCPPKVNTGRHYDAARHLSRFFETDPAVPDLKDKIKRRAANIGTSGLSTARKVPSCRVSKSQGGPLAFTDFHFVALPVRFFLRESSVMASCKRMPKRVPAGRLPLPSCWFVISSAFVTSMPSCGSLHTASAS